MSMDETAKLGLPLVQPAQAQKHVTVNEALTRLDGLCQLVLASRGVMVPPNAPEEGEAYAVPVGAVNAWDGQDGAVALFVNGGWTFVAPRAGWRAWIEDEGVAAVHDGVSWVAGALSVSENGAALAFRSIEVEHAVSAGATSVVAGAIPARAIVFGVSGVVTEAIGGASAWSLGNDAGSADRFGSGIGTGVGAWVKGELGAPTTYYGATDLLLTAEGGDFTGGRVRLAVHYAQIGVPRV